MPSIIDDKYKTIEFEDKILCVLSLPVHVVNPEIIYNLIANTCLRMGPCLP